VTSQDSSASIGSGGRQFKSSRSDDLFTFPVDAAYWSNDKTGTVLQMRTESPSRHWTFLSNHAHVLVCLALDPNSRLRDVALSVGITERAVQKIVDDLQEEGVIRRERAGRRNAYRFNVNVPLRHPLEAQRTVASLLAMMLDRTALKRLPSF
jgi:hypothetical protein